MKIVKLSVENIKKLVAVEINPQGNLVELKGNNGSGKTSILDSIWWAFAGLSNVQDKPIREGQDKGVIRLDVGDFTITRTFVRVEDDGYTSSIKVVNKEGISYQSPQTMLDKLFNSLSFKPLKFAEAQAKDQMEMVRSLVPGFDFKKSEKEEKEFYEQRTVANRRAKDARTLETGFKDYPLVEPPKVDTKALTDSLANLAQQNSEIETERLRRQEVLRVQVEEVRTKSKTTRKEAKDVLEKAKTDYEAAIKLVQDTLAKAKTDYEAVLVVQDKVEEAADQVEKDTTALAPLPSLGNVEALKKQLEQAVETNNLWDKWNKMDQCRKDAVKYEEEGERLTGLVEGCRQARFDAVAKAGLPVEGLGFNDEGVTLNGVPFAQASHAERLRVSVVLAMAQNPTLKVIRVEDGSLLDDTGMAILAEMAEKNDCQIWIERVGTGGETGFLLEDGQLKQ